MTPVFCKMPLERLRSRKQAIVLAQKNGMEELPEAAA
jgi:hypothetical protein